MENGSPSSLARKNEHSERVGRFAKGTQTVSVLVVGSVAFDTVRTPFGLATEVVGGSANYFAVAASFFTDVRLVAVVGEDFPGSASGVPPQPRGGPAGSPASAGEDLPMGW